MTRNMLAERWQSRYFGDYRPGENTSLIRQSEVETLMDTIPADDRGGVIQRINELQDNKDGLAAEFGCTFAMADALVHYVRRGGA